MRLDLYQTETALIAQEQTTLLDEARMIMLKGDSLSRLAENKPMISEELRTILSCPACKGALSDSDINQSLTCLICGLSFPIREGIPVMLVDEATSLLK